MTRKSRTPMEAHNPVPAQILEGLEPPRKIVIVGASISGLTLLLALRRVCHIYDLNLNPIIYERRTTFWEQGPVYILWRWSIAALEELGLGNGLKRISYPIDKFKSIDAENGEVYVSWPPSPDTMTPEDLHKMGDPSLPIMVAVRHSDLVRLLLIALANADDPYLASPTGECQLSNLSSTNWFEREGYEQKIPELQMGRELDSYRISDTTGLITAKIHAETLEQVFMLIGADGVDSGVRELLFTRYYPQQYARLAVISGLSNVFGNLDPMAPSPVNSRPPTISQAETGSTSQTGSCTTFLGEKANFGVISMGHGRYGWNLVLPQDHQGRLAEDWTQHLRGRREHHFHDIIHHVSPVSHHPIFEEFLNGEQVRDMALHLARSMKLTRPASTLIELSDPNSTSIQDVFDFGVVQVPSYTSPNFHPGRVILIGDAAHAMATNAQGSVGAGLAITDAVLLAKLMGQFLIRGPGQNDDTSLANLGHDFDEMRVSICNDIVLEARKEAEWHLKPSSWVMYFLRFLNKLTRGVWKAPNFLQMMTRGGIPQDANLPSLSLPDSTGPVL